MDFQGMKNENVPIRAREAVQRHRTDFSVQATTNLRSALIVLRTDRVEQSKQHCGPTFDKNWTRTACDVSFYCSCHDATSAVHGKMFLWPFLQVILTLILKTDCWTCW